MAESTSIWSTLVGQRHAVKTLQRAADGHGMTHAWLFTGPPGSGRSNAALAFAAALQCESGGCGQCAVCRDSLSGAHIDVSVTRSERAVIPVDVVRELVVRAALRPGRGQWQVMVVEDADRLNDAAANALLKAIEEPAPRTVWLLCAPSVEDVLPTIRSRCRNVVLTTPSVSEVTGFLVDKVGASAEVAAYAARASQGHIGRARALALDESARRRRGEVVRIPPRLVDIGSCMNAAERLMGIAKEETESITDEVNSVELRDLQQIFGSDPAATSSRAYKAALKRLEEDQTQRAKRRVMDVIDRCLMDLLSVYRDALALSSSPDAELINEELRPDLREFVGRSTPEENVRRIGSVFEARQRMLEHNAAPQLALESMMVALRTR